jgi:hypothetical protein
MMSDILYERSLSEGHVVRIRRLTPAGTVPVRAVIEIDRRAESPHASASGGHPPILMTAEGESEPYVVASLFPYLDGDASIERLIAQRVPR